MDEVPTPFIVCLHKYLERTFIGLIDKGETSLLLYDWEDKIKGPAVDYIATPSS